MKDSFIMHTCPVCGLSKKYVPSVKLLNKYAVIRCQNCQLESVNPLPSPEELQEYYTTYHTTKETEYRNTKLVELHKSILDYLLAYFPEPENLMFLDYGFGAGAFLKCASQRGLQVFGAEFSDQNCKQIEKYCEQKGLPIKTVNVSNSGLELLNNIRFNCITLFQVIEHCIDPLNLLKRLSSFQKEGDIIYLECPNNDAFYLRIKNIIRNYVGREDFFNSLNPPQHLHGFNRKSMKFMLEEAGYTPIDINDYYFADGLHQVETLAWYPPLIEAIKNGRIHNAYSLSKSFIGMAEPLASKLFGAGGGLYSLAKKTS